LAERTRLGVLGWPVAHSRSPQIQNAALEAAGLGGWRYQLLPVPPELFDETVLALPGAGFRGVNVTIPHKQAALALADNATEAASAIGAANTLTFEGEGMHADNTDAPALIGALPFVPSGRTALVLGAGGSARAAVWALRQAGAAEVYVWNRHPARAEALTAELGGIPVSRARPADMLINCTPVGMDGDRGAFAQLPIEVDDTSRFSCVVDLVYSEGATALIEAASARDVAVVDGVELLVRQGALSFERFTGRSAPIDAMRAAALRSPR
jgi:shikimate dehydrogenase